MFIAFPLRKPSKLYIICKVELSNKSRIERKSVKEINPISHIKLIHTLGTNACMLYVN